MREGRTAYFPDLFVKCLHAEIILRVDSQLRAPNGVHRQPPNQVVCGILWARRGRHTDTVVGAEFAGGGGGGGGRAIIVVVIVVVVVLAAAIVLLRREGLHGKADHMDSPSVLRRDGCK